MKKILAAVALAAGIACSLPVQAQQTLTFQGDTSVLGDGIVNVGIPGSTTGFNTPLSPFTVTMDGTINLNIVIARMANPLLLIWNGGPDDVNRMNINAGVAAGFAVFEGQSGPFFLPSGDYTLGFLDNFEGPGGEFLVELSGFLIIPVTVMPSSDPDVDIQLSDLALNAAKFRHSGLNRIVRQARQAQVELENAKWAQSGQAITSTNTANGVVAEGFHVWADVGGRGTDNDTANLKTRTVQTRLGLDYQITKEIAAGLGIGYARVTSDTPTTGLQGDAVWAQPYVGFQFGEVYGTASAAIVHTNYRSFNFGGGTGDAKSLGYEAHLWVGFDHDLGDDATLVPYVEGLIGHEKLTDVTSTVPLSNTGVTYLDVALGAEFRRVFAFDEGLLDTYALAEIQYSRTSGGRNGFAILNRDPNQFGLGLGAGASMAVSDVLTTSVELKVDGVGSDTLGYSARAAIDLAL